MIYKQCLKEIADSMGCSVTFMAKPYTEATGSGCHIHLSLWKKSEGQDTFGSAFVGDEDFGGVKCSPEFKWFLGGITES